MHVSARLHRDGSVDRLGVSGKLGGISTIGEITGFPEISTQSVHRLVRVGDLLTFKAGKRRGV